MFHRISINKCLLAALFPVAIALLTMLPSPGQDKKPADGKHFELDLGGGIMMKLVRIEAGKFMMGSPKSEQDYIRQKHGDVMGDYVALEKQHEVEITKPFYIGVYTVTQAEYEKILGKNPSWFSRNGAHKKEVAGLDTARFPVEQVSWEDAMEFCRLLSQKERRTIDLPTEAEWEYACRAGSGGEFHYGKLMSSKQANFMGYKPYREADKGPYLARTTQVGSYEPNPFGLYDMHGNVFQWCKDWYNRGYYAVSPLRDPQGPANPAEGTSRVLRGGCWQFEAAFCRSASRNADCSSCPNFTHGFRVVMRLH